MSLLENNFIAAVEAIKERVEKESQQLSSAEYIIGQVAYNENSFELYSAAFTAASDGAIPQSMNEDPYYNMVFVVQGVDKLVSQFRDKYLFMLAYADVSFAIHQAYRMALMSDTGEYTLTTSFYKPGITDSAWAYEDVFHYSGFGGFLCWFNTDEQYQKVEIQVDADFIRQYEELADTRLLVQS